MEETGEKITGLEPILGADVANADLLPIVDISDTTMADTGTNKKLTIEELGEVPQTLTNKTLTSPKIDEIEEATSGAGVTVDGCLIKDGKAANADKVDGSHVYSTSVILDITPNAYHTITHNLGTPSLKIFAINGDHAFNGFTITGVSYIDTNSFKFYASGGSNRAGRVNYVIFY